jgi:hypothetical protein
MLRGMAKTPLHAFRIPDALYAAALEKARAEDRTLNAVVVELLSSFVGTTGV